MNFEDFAKRIWAVIPDADFGMDNDGQIVIYTNLTTDADNDVVPMPEEVE